jgi:hypothetical protein
VDLAKDVLTLAGEMKERMGGSLRSIMSSEGIVHCAVRTNMLLIVCCA